MKQTITILFTFFLCISCFSQDQKAKAILDRLSAKTKTYKTIKTEFGYTITNDAEGINETQKGEAYIKGDKYFLSIQGQDIISNGQSIWTYIKESEEVHINDMPEEEEEESLTPNKIFTLYETGFKYKYIKEEAGLQVVDLYPKEPEEKPFHRVVLYINESKGQISKVMAHYKDGTRMTYRIKTFLPNIKIADTKFEFDKAKYPNIEVIDLRE